MNSKVQQNQEQYNLGASFALFTQVGLASDVVVPPNEAQRIELQQTALLLVLVHPNASTHLHTLN